MNPLQSSNSSPLSELSWMIVDASIASTDMLAGTIEEHIGKERSFNMVYARVLLEFASFYMHIMDRTLSKQLSNDKKTKPLNDLGLMVINNTFSNSFHEDNKEEIRKHFFDNLNCVAIDYSTCTEWLLDPKDDTSNFDKEQTGKKSLSLCGQLSDNISQHIYGKFSDVILRLQVSDSVTRFAKDKKLVKITADIIRELR